jgi:hypothetical protein
MHQLQLRHTVQFRDEEKPPSDELQNSSLLDVIDVVRIVILNSSGLISQFVSEYRTHEMILKFCRSMKLLEYHYRPHPLL